MAILSKIFWTKLFKNLWTQLWIRARVCQPQRHLSRNCKYCMALIWWLRKNAKYASSPSRTKISSISYLVNICFTLIVFYPGLISITHAHHADMSYRLMILNMRTEGDLIIMTQLLTFYKETLTQIITIMEVVKMAHQMEQAKIINKIALIVFIIVEINSYQEYFSL